MIIIAINFIIHRVKTENLLYTFEVCLFSLLFWQSYRWEVILNDRAEIYIFFQLYFNRWPMTKATSKPTTTREIYEQTTRISSGGKPWNAGLIDELSEMQIGVSYTWFVMISRPVSSIHGLPASLPSLGFLCVSHSVSLFDLPMFSKGSQRICSFDIKIIPTVYILLLKTILTS